MRALNLLLAVGLMFAASAPIAEAKRPVKHAQVKTKLNTPPTPRVAPGKTETLPENAAAAPVYGAAPILAPANRRQENQLVFDGIPVAPAAIKAKLNQYASIRSASFMDFLPNGGVLISTRFGDAAQVHRVDAPLADRRQLTFFLDPVGSARVRPNGGGQFVFTKDQGGDEFHQLYLYDPLTGNSTQLSEPQSRNEAPVFSRDGARVIWSRATAADPNFDLMWMDLNAPSSRRVILEGEGALEPLDFSPDGRYLLYGRYESVAKSRRFLLDLSTGTPSELTPNLNVSYDGGEFTPDGQSIILISDEASSFSRLVRLDLKSQKRTNLSPADIQWDVESFDLSPDGKTLAYVINAGGQSELRFADIRTGKALPGVALPPGLVLNPRFDQTGARIGLSLNAGNSPSDAYVYDMKAAKLTRWTESEPGGLNPATFVTPTLTSYPTFDNAGAQRRMIPAFVYKPRVTGRAPVILFIHGGPEAQFRPSFSSPIQYWVNELGFAVVAPNVRGSTGYGRDYVALDNGFKREDSVKDIGAALDWIATQPDLDPTRVVVYGGSYGGYMAYAAMAQYNARLAGGVSVVGISNWVSFLENTKGYRRDLRRVEYGDERDPNTRAFMQRISPLTNAANITKPLLVVQGANDPRVPMSEAEQMVFKVRSNGGDAWYLLGLDEGHGFQKKSNQEAQRAVEAMFLNKVARGNARP